MKTYRVAVIGATGRGDYGHGVDVAFTKVPGVEIIAVADASDVGRAAAQKRISAPTAYADYHQMLAQEKPDIVGICPDTVTGYIGLLFEILAADRAGKVGYQCTQRYYVCLHQYVLLWREVCSGLLVAGALPPKCNTGSKNQQEADKNDVADLFFVESFQNSHWRSIPEQNMERALVSKNT